MADAWTWQEYDTIRTRYPKEGADIVKDLNNRSVVAVKNRALKMYTSECLPFNEEELKYAKKFGSTLGTALIFLFPDRSPVEIEDLLKCVK